MTGILVVGAVLVGAAVGYVIARAQCAARMAQVLGADPAAVPDIDRASQLEALEAAAQASERRAARVEAQRGLLIEAINAFADGVIVVDANGNEFLRNPAAAQFDQARHADALAEQAIEDLLAAARNGVAVSKELSLFGPPRRVLHLEAVPLRSVAGVVRGAAVVVRDVSEVHRIDNVRRDFVANVSHELKTPIGALALLAETMASDSDPVVMAQLAERVVREADRLGDIVDDLLDLSLIEAQEAPTREPLPVAVLVAEAVDRVASAASAKAIELRNTATSAQWVIECDRRQLVSAVTNLLDNAIKYSDPGAQVEIGATVQGQRVAIEVRDHGIGIPSRDLERIFERFYRVDRARSRATGGTGLGLSIVRHVARAHGGDIAVESREGEGSTFRLWFPLVVNARTSEPVPITEVAKEAS